MKKLILVSITLSFFLLATLAVFSLSRGQSQEDTNLQPVSMPVQPSTINYTHPSGIFAFEYPKNWEFVPKREDMGLRPKEYGGYSKNEIVTILLFKNKGSNILSAAKEYDGGFDEEWLVLIYMERVGINMIIKAIN
jgi:hypothetical protein